MATGVRAGEVSVHLYALSTCNRGEVVGPGVGRGASVLGGTSLRHCAGRPFDRIRRI